eukprot:scaffold135247_cov31-Tisochrysis_lutea.AAC.2
MAALTQSEFSCYLLCAYNLSAEGPSPFALHPSTACRHRYRSPNPEMGVCAVCAWLARCT